MTKEIPMSSCHPIILSLSHTQLYAPIPYAVAPVLQHGDLQRQRFQAPTKSLAYSATGKPALALADPTATIPQSLPPSDTVTDYSIWLAKKRSGRAAKFDPNKQSHVPDIDCITSKSTHTILARLLGNASKISPKYHRSGKIELGDIKI